MPRPWQRKNFSHNSVTVSAISLRGICCLQLYCTRVLRVLRPGACQEVVACVLHQYIFQGYQNVSGWAPPFQGSCIFHRVCSLLPQVHPHWFSNTVVFPCNKFQASAHLYRIMCSPGYEFIDGAGEGAPDCMLIWDSISLAGPGQSHQCCSLRSKIVIVLTLPGARGTSQWLGCVCFMAHAQRSSVSH